MGHVYTLDLLPQKWSTENVGFSQKLTSDLDQDPGGRPTTAGKLSNRCFDGLGEGGWGCLSSGQGCGTLLAELGVIRIV